VRLTPIQIALVGWAADNELKIPRRSFSTDAQMQQGQGHVGRLQGAVVDGSTHRLLE